jgi:hypothetical protein
VIQNQAAEESASGAQTAIQNAQSVK